MKNLTKKQRKFLDAAHKIYGKEIESLTRVQILEVCKQNDMKEPQWLVKPSNRISRGEYALPKRFVNAPAVVVPKKVQEQARVAEVVIPFRKPSSNSELTVSESRYEGMVPTVDPNYVKFGIYHDMRDVIKSRQFYPIFVSGLSGNGKSLTTEQICAELGREFFQISITKSTNEDDLLGGFRLVNGETVWFDGPVTQAAERGAICQLDELDYGSAEISCLQKVLEGKPFLIKKINKVVTPKLGFNIIATANTKGQGDTVGKFAYTNVMNEALLERFAMTLDQNYPEKTAETKILMNYLDSLGCPDKDFAMKLVTWASTNRETFFNNGCSEVISTRRLVHIVKAFSMFGDRRKAVSLCLNRFDNDNKESLFDLYCKIDDSQIGQPAPAIVSANPVAATPDPTSASNVPY